MKLEIINIKNETAVKFDKSLKSIKNKFFDTLSIALDATVHEIDQEKRKEVEFVIDDMFNDEFNKMKVNFIKLLNKVNDEIEKGL